MGNAYCSKITIDNKNVNGSRGSVNGERGALAYQTAAAAASTTDTGFHNCNTLFSDVCRLFVVIVLSTYIHINFVSLCRVSDKGYGRCLGERRK